MDKTFCVYLVASGTRVLYCGVTNNLARRVREHKRKLVPGFTQRYNVTRLVWFEPHDSAMSAIVREKEIKRWRRAKKVALIEAENPKWMDLSQHLR